MIYGDDVVDHHWPYDGPHNDDQTTQAAAAISRLVRYLNNATGPGHSDSALPYAAIGYRVISNLTNAVHGLRQLLPQLAEFLERQAADPTLYDDRRGGPNAMPADDTASAAAYSLRSAMRHVSELASDLNLARSHAVHLGNEDPR
ncbi:hypothetical protein [Actinocrispum wychmicini]|uniref:Uncharacterized protein n=1 Tax=Actinocrispum wychmicini TaxID=1213861 RepID=A0A4V2S6S5_9PSEU|nr:hypothetical protein [Actinocrispum wychmicini]TCO57190.1 hypothetical protein EV192_106667 [Actinocrispum wychmicini]